MIDDEMFARVRVEAEPCPGCGHAEAQPIFWGYPGLEAYHRTGDRVSLGGNCRPAEPRAHVSAACREASGNAGMRPAEAVDPGEFLPVTAPTGRADWIDDF